MNNRGEGSGLRVDEEQEALGLDLSQHAETMGELVTPEIAPDTVG